jgi:hypothetical protein
VCPQPLERHEMAAREQIGQVGSEEKCNTGS